MAQEFEGLRLRRAQAADADRLGRMQEQAYARNRVLIGTTPIPLQWDYAAVIAEREAWLADGSDGLEAALIVSLRDEDLYIDSVSVAPRANGRGLGNKLLAFAEMRARHHNRNVLRLITGEKLVQNIEWYQRKGYVIERSEVLPDRTLAHMVKHI